LIHEIKKSAKTLCFLSAVLKSHPVFRQPVSFRTGRSQPVAPAVFF
jgi:hypothetical protein